MIYAFVRRSTIGLALATVLFSASCDGSRHHSSDEISLSTIRASSAQSRRVEIPSRIEVRGTVEAERSAAVSSRVTAMVTTVRVRAGDRVRKNEVLIEIDPATARGQLGQATGALAQAEAALALASRNYERFRALAETEAASELELDMARMQLEQATGAVEQATGAVQAARSVAEESSVRAPFDGLVVRRMVEVGDLAAPGRPLLKIESEAGRRLALDIPESLMTSSGLVVGDPLEVAIDGYPQYGIIGATIAERSSAADPMTHSFEVKAELPEVAIASGTTGRAWISGPTRSAVLVPHAAVHRHGGLTLVVVKTDEGRSETRIVTVGGEIDDQNVEILSGLAGGETVLVGLPAPPPNGSPLAEEA